MEKIVYIAFGANLGEREDNIQRAIACLRGSPSLEIIKISTTIETDPVGGPIQQNKYLNGVIKARTSLEAHDLLSFLNKIESELGRIRTVQNGPRPIDLDILLYGEETINTARLTVPHPRMFERDFVLKPLLEIEPEIITMHSLVIPHKEQIESIV